MCGENIKKSGFPKSCLSGIGILIASVLIGTLLMFAVYSLPVEKMQAHVQETISTQISEGDHYRFMSKDRTSTSDGFTDSLMLNIAVSDFDENIICKALLNPWSVYTGAESMTEQLANTVSDIRADSEGTYARYWHGYLVVLKLLLLFFNYSQIRMLNALVSCSLIAIILCGFYKRFKTHKYSLAFLGAVLFLNPVVLMASLQFSTVFYIILLEYTAALYWGDALDKKGKFNFIFLLSGIFTAFFDLLTYPIAALGMLLILQLLLFKDTFIRNVLRAVKSSVCWIFGYLGMWSGKWIVASLLTGEDVIANALHAVTFRTGTSSGIEGWDFSWGGLFRSNFGWLVGANAILFKMFMIILIVGVLFLLITKKVKLNIDLPFVALLVLFCFIPIARYIVFSNHSFMHGFITYREGIVYVMASLCGGLSCLRQKEDSCYIP